MKVDPVRKLVIADGDEMEDVNLDDLREELPERQPRFVVLAYRFVRLLDTNIWGSYKNEVNDCVTISIKM